MPLTQNTPPLVFKKFESEQITSSRPTDLEDGTQIVHCDYYDLPSKSYCKKLKASCVRHSGLSSFRGKKENVLLCGCPKTSGQNYCNALRKNCSKHEDWENIRQADILLMELTYMQTEKQLIYEEKITGKRMARRRHLMDDTQRLPH